ncbi:Hdr menaquinol oxidoreductase integral membrane subunit [Desulfomarina profundi]|uniref:Hdr menaquinol oxidoreductase integral membrane subunit n=1 Tax=Desulfomarina profundi TaxID=2772557 RepID=A0A8D5FWW5_9BACT|nr:NrfD/PsrC family molybdoenzyme membrane anchor subunit [Desulfomarina profundi]BCL62831.1 Hdr menaquinol oxidoreductase integral membrane subunit [Desulfomarina profundi]
MNAVPHKNLKSFLTDAVRWNLRGGIAFQIFRIFLLFGMGFGIYAYSFQARFGLSVTGMNDIVSWGLYISNFTFLVGVAAAAVMLILPAYMFHDPGFHRVVIIGEGVAVGALVMCLSFIAVDLGGPLQAWHLIPGIGLFNFPSSILAWDVLVLNGYLLLNGLVPAYILYSHYMGRKADERKYRPFVFLSIFWAFSIHMVTAFLYQGLPARPFWNNPLMGPRFLASAFAAGPALIALILAIIHSTTDYKIDRKVFRKLRLIITISAIVNLIMLFSEIFKEFYFPTHHSSSAVYLFFGMDGHNSLVPWIWTSVIINLLATLVIAFNPGKDNPKVLLPACGFLFIAVWMEKGIGLIVPGLIPSPLGEVVDYLPTWVELGVTLGILCLGITVVTWLIRTALIIEQRYEGAD